MTTKNIKCLVVDDEPLAIKILENHISNISGFDVVATAQNAMIAFEILKSQPIDLMFLDIKMPKLTGFQLLDTLNSPPKTVLTTAYREYAVESYDFEVIDYLLKPIDFERFLKSIERYRQTEVIDCSNPIIHLKSGGEKHVIQSQNIIFIESFKDYIKIHLTDRCISLKYKIGTIEEELPGKYFLRVHRSFIINLRRIKSYNANFITVEGHQIPKGSSYRKNVDTLLSNFF